MLQIKNLMTRFKVQFYNPNPNSTGDIEDFRQRTVRQTTNCSFAWKEVLFNGFNCFI